ncbi:hypothetical protein G6O69_38525 [Pseudenhygromyxa sp. WMMC2535]|uniref:hypothetical protein n=1 Tax=Pseudenhygromyxa sp. WMMC2535 TaxID=2712867 RepID=UPI0015951A4B|nr:hypothetical protein [Pseudenhygromyxa sp. WMMC2535]NVB43758.1 hypothetical protein [Pseudenhygromyxa sp. WMMC2535]
MARVLTTGTSWSSKVPSVFSAFSPQIAVKLLISWLANQIKKGSSVARKIGESRPARIGWWVASR